MNRIGSKCNCTLSKDSSNDPERDLKYVAQRHLNFKKRPLLTNQLIDYADQVARWVWRGFGMQPVSLSSVSFEATT